MASGKYLLLLCISTWVTIITSKDGEEWRDTERWKILDLNDPVPDMSSTKISSPDWVGRKTYCYVSDYGKSMIPVETVGVFQLNDLKKELAMLVSVSRPDIPVVREGQAIDEDCDTTYNLEHDTPDWLKSQDIYLVQRQLDRHCFYINRNNQFRAVYKVSQIDDNFVAHLLRVVIPNDPKYLVVDGSFKYDVCTRRVNAKKDFFEPVLVRDFKLPNFLNQFRGKRFEDFKKLVPS